MFEYNNKILLQRVNSEFKNHHISLVDSSSISQLRKNLLTLKEDNRFILNIGPCAEELNIKKFIRFFQFTQKLIPELTKKINKKIIFIGRNGGQSFKPRTAQFEIRNNKIIPSYFGDAVNSIEFDERARICSPKKLVENFAYIIKALDIVKNNNNYFTSHEFCMVEYEKIFIKNNYLTTTHFPWIGYRSLFKNFGLIETLKTIKNPIGIKIGPNIEVGKLLNIIRALNPHNESSKIILIFRLGNKNIHQELPLIIEELIKSKINFISLCDPMHGNNYKNGKIKYRLLDEISLEVASYLQILKDYNLYNGGIHLEVTDEEVVECVENIEAIPLQNYKSRCDPRLNKKQLKKLLSDYFYE